MGMVSAFSGLQSCFPAVKRDRRAFKSLFGFEKNTQGHYVRVQCIEIIQEPFTGCDTSRRPLTAWAVICLCTLWGIQNFEKIGIDLEALKLILKSHLWEDRCFTYIYRSWWSRCKAGSSEIIYSLIWIHVTFGIWVRPIERSPSSRYLFFDASHADNIRELFSCCPRTVAIVVRGHLSPTPAVPTRLLAIPGASQLEVKKASQPCPMKPVHCACHYLH